MEGLSARVARIINIKERDFSIDSIFLKWSVLFSKNSLYIPSKQGQIL